MLATGCQNLGRLNRKLSEVLAIELIFIIMWLSKNLFWSIKHSGEVLDKLKAKDFNATSLSTL